MDSTRYNDYLRAAREHGRHVYAGNGELREDEYSDACLQRAFEDGFKQEHELEAELL